MLTYDVFRNNKQLTYCNLQISQTRFLIITEQQDLKLPQSIELTDSSYLCSENYS